MSAKLFRRRIGAFKVEGTFGTAEALAAADAATRTYDFNVTPSGNYVRRDAQGGRGENASVVGQRSATGSFMTYLHGKGTAGVPHHGQLWEACGMVLATATYTTSDASASWKGVTLGHYQGDFLKRLRGGMGSATLQFTPGEQVSVQWTFAGGYVSEPSDTSILTGQTYETPSASPPTWAGSGRLTLDGQTTYKVGGLTIELDNSVSVREDQLAIGGVLGGFCEDLSVRVSIDPEAVNVSAKDWSAAFYAGTTFDLVAVVGTGTNGIVTVTASGLQLTADPAAFGDRAGKLTQPLQAVGRVLSIAYT